MTYKAAALAILLLAACCGCGRSPGSDLRTFSPVDGDRWIGNAVCYGPHRDGQRPGGPAPTADQLREDLRLMLPHWNLVRIYGASGFAEDFLATIRADGAAMKVMLGVWIDPEDDPDKAAANRREVADAVRLAGAYPDIVVAVCVGNETQVSWSGHRCPPEVLIGHVRTVRRAVSLPVTVADDFNFWNKPESVAVAREVDFITMHAHPLWNGLQLADALPWLQDQLAEVSALHPERPVVVGETGWATTVHTEGEQAELIKGRAGEAELRTYLRDVRAWAEADRVPVFFFEAFDENWKGGDHPDEVEKHWGVFRADRTQKGAG